MEKQVRLIVVWCVCALFILLIDSFLRGLENKMGLVARVTILYSTFQDLITISRARAILGVGC